MKQYTFFGAAFLVWLFLLAATVELMWPIPFCFIGMVISFICGQLWKEWVVVQVMKVDGIAVEVYNEELSMEEIRQYIERAKLAKPTAKLEKIQLVVEGKNVEIVSEYAAVPFERIRRITGYLVGNLDRFNDAKKAEVNDRVSHMERDLADVLAEEER